MTSCTPVMSWFSQRTEAGSRIGRLEDLTGRLGSVQQVLTAGGDRPLTGLAA